MATEYVAVVFTILFTIATSALLGGYMFRVFTGAAHVAGPDPRPDRAAGPAADRRRSERAAGLEAVLGVAARLERVHVAGHLDDRDAPAVPAAQSRRHRQHGADAGVQHDLELHHQHEPAALQRRDRAVVLLADVHRHVPAVRDGRHRRGGGGGDDSRAGRQSARHSSATSTSISRARPFGCSCRWRCSSRS